MQWGTVRAEAGGPSGGHDLCDYVICARSMGRLCRLYAGRSGELGPRAPSVFLFLFSTSPAVEAPNAAAAAVTAATIALVIMVVEERRKQLGVLRFCAVHASFRLFVLPLSMLTLFPLFLEEEEK